MQLFKKDKRKYTKLIGVFHFQNHPPTFALYDGISLFIERIHEEKRINNNAILLEAKYAYIGQTKAKHTWTILDPKTL